MNSHEVISSEDSERQIRVASRYAALIGAMPATFSTAIKELMVDDQHGLPCLSERSEFQIGRVLRGATALSVIYWAGRTFTEEKMPPGWIYSSLQIARFFKPSTLAALLAFTYLFKRAKRIIDPEEWQFISEPLQKNTEICALLGWHLPEVGSTVGLIGGAMTNIAFACYCAHDKRGFTEYRRLLRMKRQFQMPATELSNWGCTSLQIATQLMLQSGFGVDITHSFIEGFRDPLPLPNGERARGPFVAVHKWLRELAGTSPGTAGSTEQGQSNTSASNNPILTEKLMTIHRQGSLYHWLEKGAADISAEATPNLLLDGVLFK